MRISSKSLPTTVVGSYPAVRGGGVLRAFTDPWKQALEIAVSDQITAGIDIISNGQVRGDMITAYISKIPGIKGHKVIGKIEAPQKPIALQDTEYALSCHPKVKGILTGPSTLAYGLKIDTPIYRDRGEVALDLAEVLAGEAAALERAGVTIVQVDEPILSTGAADLGIGRQAVNTVISVLQIPSCLHACGDITGVIDELLRINVSVFDFEFSCNTANLEALSKRDLRGRMVGYGCVDSSNESVDSVGIIQDRIRRGIEAFDPEQMLIDPDCGLRMHTRETAFAKLKNMVEAVRILRAEL